MFPLVKTKKVLLIVNQRKKKHLVQKLQKPQALPKVQQKVLVKILLKRNHKFRQTNRLMKVLKN